jgi:hypothetical protein
MNSGAEQTHNKHHHLFPTEWASKWEEGRGGGGKGHARFALAIERKRGKMATRRSKKGGARGREPEEERASMNHKTTPSISRSQHSDRILKHGKHNGESKLRKGNLQDEREGHTKRAKINKHTPTTNTHTDNAKEMGWARPELGNGTNSKFTL